MNEPIRVTSWQVIEVCAPGRLRAEPLRDALSRFERPATVISESPGEESHQAIRVVLSTPAAPGL
jgi:hypothetical protein